MREKPRGTRTRSRIPHHRIERAYGSFVRSFTLPEETLADKVAAEFKDGRLLVHLPKTVTPKPIPMEVKVA